MSRIFVIDGREFPDPNPNLTVDEVHRHLMCFYPELVNAELKESTDGGDTIIEFEVGPVLHGHAVNVIRAHLQSLSEIIPPATPPTKAESREVREEGRPERKEVTVAGKTFDLGLKLPFDAHEVAEELIASIASHVSQQAQSQKPVSTKEAIEKFLASSYAPRSPESKRSYKDTWAPFSAVFDIMPTTPEPIERYVLPYNKGNTTRWNILVRLRCVYSFAEERLGLSPNPFKLIKVEKGQAAETEPFTPEQAKVLFQAIETDRERVYFYTMYGQGLRLGEVRGLNYEDIRDDKVWLEKGKERKEWAPLLPEVRDAILMGNGHTSGPVVVGRQGRVSDSTVQSDIKKWFKRAGVRVKKISPHTLRHSFSTHLYLAGCDWDAVDLLLRHKQDKRQVTNIYLHLTPEQRLGILGEKLARHGPIRMLNGSEPELGEKPDCAEG